mmetsp:Transcript_24941/g.39167  ORF Transcript_24941/g.39167 Transcript_24941/m.39167 type:complete len:83 (+) Transcript_24941:277-525(+)
MHRLSRHRIRPALRHMNIPTIVLMIIALIMDNTIITVGITERTINDTTVITITTIEEDGKDDILAETHTTMITVLTTTIPIE